MMRIPSPPHRHDTTRAHHPIDRQPHQRPPAGRHLRCCDGPADRHAGQRLRRDFTYPVPAGSHNPRLTGAQCRA